MKMYRTTAYGIKIEALEVIKATDKTIWFVNETGREDRELKTTDSRQWHEAKEDAIAFLLKKYTAEKQRHENRLADINSKIEQIKSL